MDIFENGKKLPLVEEFYTLQGEGYHMGKAAYFIRIGGCDIGCRWCDTKISWNANIHPLADVDTLVDKIKGYPAKSVVVTGGEPTTYNLNYLCNKLKNEKIETFLETSGAYALTGEWDWICLSPKKNQPPRDEFFKKANELKVIIFDEDDINWAEENAAKVNSNCKLYLQPEWSMHKEWTPKIIDYVKQNPKWQISIQAHKFMHIP
ncbi:MAG: 7-carboxy-7-deazaguanine synthase QueE [Bacteroidales bacterium]|nr:7-carboxy-7-deazaguanine synthase QueE [Bacteroidales bacterium]